MNKNEANSILSSLMSSGVAEAFSEVINNSNDIYNKCCRVVGDYLSLSDSPRLYSDMSLACLTKAMSQYPWEKCGLRASIQSRGAYDRVELLSESIQIIVSRDGDYNSEYKKNCFKLNDASGKDGVRGVILCYVSDDLKRIISARLVMLNSNKNELSNVPVFPANNAPTILVG